MLGRTKLAQRLTRLATSVEQLVESLLADLEVIEEPAVEPIITADADDDRVLACALAANARYIVSGDRHLLDLENYKGIAILRSAEMLAKLPPRSAKP